MSSYQISIVKVIHLSHILAEDIFLKPAYINGKGGAIMTQIQNKLQQMKLEIAAEFGIENYDLIDKGELPSRMNGKIGGEMTKRLIELGKMQLVQMSQRELVPILVKREQVMKKQLMLPWPEQYSGDFLPAHFHYNSQKNNFYK
ncbi:MULTISPECIES: alpha/beta-type small acid-soluble spore protein [unclassified Lysinibacillus]|uniref:alpha/beta-type small acid-soluble spore protein n=1 Tax=unclassified Lysinibacillus TaxID=2636778 RepID=UPI00269887AD|nr:MULTISPECIES: alpha/beta-type small acid-soluble spore protein [unclassified Lysinibacillus]